MPKKCKSSSRKQEVLPAHPLSRTITERTAQRETKQKRICKKDFMGFYGHS